MINQGIQQLLRLGVRRMVSSQVLRLPMLSNILNTKEICQPYHQLGGTFYSLSGVNYDRRCCSTATAPLTNQNSESHQPPGVVETNKDVRDQNERDPTKVVSLETSMEYLKSDAYNETYGDNNVWVLYRRNFKGQFAPKKTRKSCFRSGKLTTGNPCPICRDEYLVLDYRNVALLKQFISPFNGEILATEKTGLCRQTHFHLLAAIEKARDYGTITFDVKFREYNYEEYYSKHLLDKA